MRTSNSFKGGEITRYYSTKLIAIEGWAQKHVLRRDVGAGGLSRLVGDTGSMGQGFARDNGPEFRANYPDHPEFSARISRTVKVL